MQIYNCEFVTVMASANGFDRMVGSGYQKSRDKGGGDKKV